MTIRINRKYYEVSPAFMTLVKYRAMTGQSYIKNIGNTDHEALIKLIYCGLQNSKINIIDFTKECEADEELSLSALFFQKELLKMEEEMPKNNGDNGSNIDNFDEYSILTHFSVTGLPESLLNVLNTSSLVSLMNKCAEIKSGACEQRKMTQSEMNTFYGISREREKKIEQYLEDKKGW